MISQNFEFLRRRRPMLADLGGFAEHHAHSDPQSSLLKQRAFVEQVVAAIYEEAGLPWPYSTNLNDLLNEVSFRQSVPEVMQQMLHCVRMAGNQAVHSSKPIPKELSLTRLRQTFEIAQWFHISIDRGQRSDCPAYNGPVPAPVQTNGKAKEALEKQKAAEAKYEELLKQVEEERTKRHAAEQAIAQTAEELAALKQRGQEVVNTLQYNEAITRRELIDAMLVEAGWNVGPRGKSTDQVGQEVPLTTMPTTSGEGYADYVLYGDDGKPLAVVEAKKTAKDALVGAEQARVYAVCLEKQTGQRPLVFFTNGIDIFVWDDEQGHPWRKVYGFYSKDSLEYALHQRKNRQPLAKVAPNPTIAERMYQLEAIRRVCERFTSGFRRSLIVLATGTGKTRVAISFVDVLMRAGWAKRVLFLCDRRELRKQAFNTFKDFLPNEPRVIVSAGTASDRDKRIYVATYPAMMKCFEEFDVGFFDLIIADESHRGIYNKYGDLFKYFDALQVGLTATPVKFIERNTYKLFGCENQDPTAHFSFDQAIQSSPPYLVPFRVRTFSSQFREKGIKYTHLSAEQQNELEAQDPMPEQVDYEPGEIDRDVFNRDTTRALWRSLMEEGIREVTGSHVGKTIVFARNHTHAMHLAEVFQQTYPQYDSTFCRVIDNYETYAEDLIDTFKSNDPALKHPMYIAISVDMLDTGIDVPEVVNLVFAKPVKSFVKFWQMIGRGTRLRRDLFGPGKDKTEFLIFDHWSNFWYFDEQYQEKQPTVQKSLLQHLFEARVEVAAAALQKMNEGVFQSTVDLIVSDLRELKQVGCIDVRDRYKELEQLSDRDRVAEFAAVTHADLLSIAAPLMHWRVIRGDEDAYRFDLLVTRAQAELLRSGPSGGRVRDHKSRIEEQVELLMKNQNPVKAKAATIQQVRSKDFWSGVGVPALEDVRLELRGIMKYQQQTTVSRVAPQVLDVRDADFKAEDYLPKLGGLDLVEYKTRVNKVILEHFSAHPTLQRIRDGKVVRDDELEELSRLVLQVDDKANVRHLVGYQPEARRSLLAVFRGLVGLDHAAVDAAFTAFVHKHPALSAQQLRFLQILKNTIAEQGGIEIERLYEPPFTNIHSDGLDGVFSRDEEVSDILHILATFEPREAPRTDPPPASERAS